MSTIRFDDWFEILDPDEIRLKGHRIWLEDVVDLYQAGKTIEELIARFPTVAPDHIHATLTYYEQHRAELDEYLARHRAYAAEQTQRAEAHQSPAAQRLRALLQARQQTRSLPESEQAKVQ